MDGNNLIEEAEITAGMLVKVEIEKFKLKTVKRLTRYLTLAAKLLMIIVFGVAAITSGMLALGIYWGQAIGSVPLAFLYVSLICIGLMIFFILLSKQLFGRPILKGLIREIFDEE